jgi:hypothetical protein
VHTKLPETAVHDRQLGVTTTRWTVAPEFESQMTGHESPFPCPAGGEIFLIGSEQADLARRGAVDRLAAGGLSSRH